MSYGRYVYLEDVINICKRKHADFSDECIRAAYEFACDAMNVYNKPGGDEIREHSLREAKILAEWGMGSDLIVAALLHDVYEMRLVQDKQIGFKFGDDVERILVSLDDMSDRWLKGRGNFRTTQYDDLPQIKALKNAIYVKSADRIDKLENGDVVWNVSQTLLSNITGRILYEKLESIHAFGIIDRLGSLSFQINNPGLYQEIMEQYGKLLSTNETSWRKSEIELRRAFDPFIDSGDNELDEYRRQILDFYVSKRSPGSLYGQLRRETKSSLEEWRTHLCKEKIPLYDLTLLLNDKLSEELSKFGPNDVFFKCFEKLLSKKGFYITAHSFTSSKYADYFVIADATDNLYRLFVRTRKDFMRFQYGDIIYEADFQFRNEKTEMQLPEPRRKKIKVFDESGTPVMITNGATVLDFAFHISVDLGLHFAYAMINESQTMLDRNVRLNEGDTVTIVTDKKILPDISWFESARTGMTTKYLVEHFSKRENIARLL